MIYHCIYKDECNVKKCKYRNTEDFLVVTKGLKFDRRTTPYLCPNSVYALLTSEERIVCNKGIKCGLSECVLIKNYITKENINNFLWANGSEYSIGCLIDGRTVTIDTSNTGCLSIWE